MIRRLKSVHGIAVLVLLMLLFIAATIPNSTLAQSSNPKMMPTAASAATRYCSPAAPASWRGAGCNYSWTSSATALAEQRSAPRPRGTPQAPPSRRYQRLHH